MNEKEARAIYAKMRGTIFLPDPAEPNMPIRQIPLESVSDFCKAEGYLEALKDERERGELLAKQFERFLEQVRHTHEGFCPDCNALANYRKGQGEE